MENLLSINVIVIISQLKAVAFEVDHLVTLGVVMVLSMVAYLIYRVKRRKKREKRLEAQVIERTEELNELNILLEETNQALHQEKIRVEEQRELLQIQSQELRKTNELLENRNKEVEVQNQQLEKYRNHLEEMITDRTKELIEAKKRAEESDHLKSAFLANMSHEIRTPMNAVLGFADLLEDPDLTYDERKNYLNIINKNGNALLFLINDIIDISKIEAGQMKIVQDEFCIDDLLTELFDNYTLNNKKANLKILLNIDSKERVFLKSDPERVRQILNNLLSNAVKFTEAGFVELGYSVTSFKNSQNGENDDFIQLYVKDTGIGIAPEQQRVVFERFFKIEDYKTQLYRGAGLGLTISKNLVELLGGKIWVDSTVNIGTTFYFTVPIGCSSRMQLPKVFDEFNADSDYNWEKKKILIAEDEETNFYFLETVFRKTDADIIWAKDGKEALELFKKNPDIDIVLMDIKMPSMNGYEATIEIKKLNQNAIIIAQTAYSMPNEQQEIMKAGFDDYIAKPIKANAVLKMVQKYFFH